LKTLQVDENALWKQRFRAPIVAATQIAALNPVRGLAVTNLSGIFQLHAWDVLTGDLRQITDAPAGVVFGGISPDGRYIFYHQDKQGNEIGHFVRVPFEGGEAEDITPDMPPYASFSITEALSGAVIGFTIASSGFQQYVLPQNRDGTWGVPALLFESERSSYGPLLSYNADWAVVSTTERAQNMAYCVYAFDLTADDPQASRTVLFEPNVSLRANAFCPLPGDTRLLVETDASGLERPLIWDVRTGERIDLPLPELEGDAKPLGWSPDGTRILINHFSQAVNRLYVYDLHRSTLTRLDHPSGTISSAYFYGDGTEIIANWQSSVKPAQVVALDAATGQIKRTMLTAGAAPEGQPWRSVTFTSSEGAQIQGWVAVPEGDGPFPTILHTHGGPTAVTVETFDPSAQVWLDHGFAWMSVNYRGSLTFGRDFERAIWGQLGMREVDDMAAAYRWLVDNGIARPDAVLLTGGSYGGYLTLQALGRRPDLWAGGMAQVAIADWALMYEDEAETLRGYQRSLFGGAPEAIQEQTRISSPITYAAQLRAPILVIQGENDTRCPARQMKVYEARLREMNKDIQVHWFDAGHGSRAIEQQIEHQAIMLRWAYRVLG